MNKTLTIVYILNIIHIDKYQYIKGGGEMGRDYNTHALYMKALSDETRIKIYEMLSQGELCACNILEEFDITQPTLSYHMKILSDSGLVISRKDGVWMKYSLNRAQLEKIREFFNQISENQKSR